MDKICRAMMNLIGSEICGNAVCADEIKALSDDELKALYKLSKSHDLAHLVGNALIKNSLLLWQQFRQKDFLLCRWKTLLVHLRFRQLNWQA